MQLILGDCLPALRALPSESIDTVVSDPPFGIDLQPQRRITKAIVGDGKEEAQALWREVMPELYRVAKPNTGHVLFADMLAPWVIPVLEDSGFHVKSAITWVKNNFGIGYYVRPQWEIAYYLHKGKPSLLISPMSNVWFHDRVQAPRHSCEKPVSLMEQAIRLCLPHGPGIVLDPFMGIGSTGKAALRLGHDFVGMELDEGYFQIAQARVANIVQIDENLPLLAMAGKRT